ncbi:MAG: hypothetical protein E6Q97_11205 [Desulfurellales bacterium]|nr:MAG: hypothetical protein E6Q97_11205 [Desulfurellales bacterium]
MWVNAAESVGEALSKGLHALRVRGIRQPSRVGDVLVHPHPVLTVYENPLNRVLNDPLRDANPFFHVMESLWMLAGRNDLPWLAQFNKRIASYSDNGGATQPGAYGYRWRNYFGYDQLETIIVELKNNPQTRRAVLSMWDGGAQFYDDKERPYACHFRGGDLLNAIAGSADVPCNTHAYFDTIDGRLNMTVCNRSNDIWWGAHGANAVHFSFLLEYVASMTGIPMGVYRQFSNNYHIYTNVVAEEQLMPMARSIEQSDIYFARSGPLRGPALPLTRVPLIGPALYGTADPATASIITEWTHNPESVHSYVPFLADAALPMWNAWHAFKAKDYEKALAEAFTIRAEDWRTACVDWLKRRKQRAEVNNKPFTEQIEPPADINTEHVNDRSA